MDHVIPIASGGITTSKNLALACVSCSLKKGAKEFAAIGGSEEKIKLFNPRLDVWAEHFEWDGVVVIGKTAVGSAMTELLKLNRPLVLAIREEEISLGRHP